MGLLLRAKSAVRRIMGSSENAWVGVPQLGIGDPPRRTTRALLETYNTSPWLRAVFGRIANATAATRWRLHAVRRNGRYVRDPQLAFSPQESRDKQLKRLESDGSLVEVVEHPLLHMLAGGNTLMAGISLRELSQATLDLVGETFWILEAGKYSVPTTAWPIPPHWVLQRPKPDTPYYVIQLGSQQYQFKPEAVLRFHVPDPTNPYGPGSGIGGSLTDEVDIDEYMAKHQKYEFINGARPDLLITAEGLSESGTQVLERRWLEGHQGMFRARLPKFLNKKVDVRELSKDFASMQLAQLREFQRDVVQQTAGLPPEIMGVTKNANRSTITMADYLFAKRLLVPRLELWRETMQARLIPLYDKGYKDRLILTYDSPVQEDNEYELRAMIAMPWTVSVTEWRERQGLPYKKELDGLYVITNRVQVQKTPTGDPPPEEDLSGGGEGIRLVTAAQLHQITKGAGR